VVTLSGDAIDDAGRLCVFVRFGDRRRLVVIALLALSAAMTVFCLALASPAAASNFTWTQLAPSNSPPGRANFSMAYDPATDQLLLFGGFGSEDGGTLFGDTWSWNGTTWTELFPDTSPSAREGASMAYDQSTGQLVLFGGGNGGGAFLQDTWLWSGSTWSKAPSNSPSGTLPVARDSASMAYDAASGQLLLFGGDDDNALSDTWNWNGTYWVELSPLTVPPDRFGAPMAYDPDAALLVLFGGSEGGSGATYSDTWSWNGTNWVRLATFPPPSDYTSMTYDPGTGQLVLFGGQPSGCCSGVALQETWGWTDAHWTQLSPVASPSARWGSAMADDDSTGQLVLFGGDSPGTAINAGGDVNDTWIWGSSLPAQTPEVGFALLLPLSFVVIAGVVVLRRRYKANVAVSRDSGVER
jgi:hypothetical protein